MGSMRNALGLYTFFNFGKMYNLNSYNFSSTQTFRRCFLLKKIFFYLFELQGRITDDIFNEFVENGPSLPKSRGGKSAKHCASLEETAALFFTAQILKKTARILKILVRFRLLSSNTRLLIAEKSSHSTYLGCGHAQLRLRSDNIRAPEVWILSKAVMSFGIDKVATLSNSRWIDNVATLSISR